MAGCSIAQWDKDDFDVVGLLKIDGLLIDMLSLYSACLGADITLNRRPIRRGNISASSTATDYLSYKNLCGRHFAD
jgi:DNA polymerase III alpha subunit